MADVLCTSSAAPRSTGRFPGMNPPAAHSRCLKHWPSRSPHHSLREGNLRQTKRHWGARRAVCGKIRQQPLCTNPSRGLQQPGERDAPTLSSGEPLHSDNLLKYQGHCARVLTIGPAGRFGNVVQCLSPTAAS
ncbi:hypothetical protein NDU88_001319 [Pleurodeles waltl]|uniref:Uncharacterized protein n=1 Tax=Pleurodeles waltl TaxID=8319 RepID=A0AAV7R6Q8_PLEWA|nr:hypothetical protein NDU88_001319 [Pleurodeles waltl]